MPPAGLLATLRRDADAEAKRVLAEARAEANRRRADADARVERQGAEAEAAVRHARGAERERRCTAARAEARARVLEARRAMLDAIFERADRALRDPASEAVRAAIEPLAREAAAYANGIPATIRCPPAAKSAIRRALPARTIRVRADPEVPQGIVLETDDGSLTIDNTLPARLARARPRLAIEVIVRLESERRE